MCDRTNSRKPRNYAAKPGIRTLQNESSNPPSSAEFLPWERWDRDPIRSAIDPNNLRSTATVREGRTLSKYYMTLPDGTQAWVWVPDGVITNGGLNDTPR